MRDTVIISFGSENETFVQLGEVHIDTSVKAKTVNLTVYLKTSVMLKLLLHAYDLKKKYIPVCS